MFCHTKNSKRQGRGFSFLLGCLLFVVALRCEAQNLVPNPSMEENTACPIALGFQGFSKPLHWEKWDQSPDYFHECAGALGGVDTLMGVPQNGFGYQYAYHGQAYIGMYTYGAGVGGASYREYVGCQLMEPLVPGTTYYLSFWTNASGGNGAGGSYWGTRYGCNRVGLLFTMEHNIWVGSSGPPFGLRNYAHLYSEEVIADPDEWVQVSGSFVADSAYAYLVLGNFFSNELTDTVHILPGPALGAYHFYDAVCVTTSPAGCDFTTGLGGNDSIELRVYPNPASDHVMLENAETGAIWQVHDMLGRAVAHGRSEGNGVRIPTAGWLQGQYVLMVRQERQVVLRRFNVMH